MHNYLIDFETYYDKAISIQTLGTWAYLRHPETDIYLVAIAGSDGLRYVGHPKDAPWRAIIGGRWLAHNYGFEGAVIDRLRETAVIPFDVYPEDWNCTANLSVFLGAPRDLAGAAKALLGKEIDKGMRAWMKGRTWQEAVREGKAQELLDYGLGDAVDALQIWDIYSDEWPAHERWLSQHTIMTGNRGVHTNLVQLEDSIGKLQTVKWKAQQGMPFYKPGAKGLSLKQFHICCNEHGVEIPATTDKNDPRTAIWEAKWSHIPWVRHMRDWRRANTALTKLMKMRDRTRPDGTCPFSLKYGGAHTLRWAGDGGYNMQNHNREALNYDEDLGFVSEGGDWSIDVRSHIIAAPGRKLGIVDLSQIEPRVLAWLVKDWEFLELLKTMSPYEAHARLFMGWDGGKLKKENSKLYLLAKARVLALGYGAGWEKFIAMCITYGIKPEEVLATPVSSLQINGFEDMLLKIRVGSAAKLAAFDKLGETERRIWVNAWLQVMDFREKNWRIVNFWKDLETKFKLSIKEGDHEIVLPSGRSLHYFGVQTLEGKFKAQTEMGGHFEHFYGGKLCENVTQAIARDVFAECVERIEKAGIPVLFHAHDEAITDLPDDISELQLVIDLMSITPDWLRGCPVAAEGSLENFYKK